MLKLGSDKMQTISVFRGGKTVLLLMLIFVFLSVSNQAQKKADGSAQIFLRVAVTDANGNVLANLKPENFKLFDNKKAQPITDFKVVDEPASIGILIDRSGSMGESYGSRDSKFDKQSLIREGVGRFLSASRKENSYFLLTFAEKPEITVNETSEAARISEELEKLSVVKPHGYTSLYDALAIGIEKLSDSKFDDRVLLVVSDGEDNNSEQKFKGIKNLLKKSNVTIYIVNIYDNSNTNALTQPRMLELAYLDEIAGLSGGRTFHVADKSMVWAAFELIATELRNRYLIGFTPKKSADDKSDWHDLKVKIELNPNVSGKIGKVYARNRSGYAF